MAERCDDCGGVNHVWYAPNMLWNLVIGGPFAKDDPGGVVCPNCFIVRAEAVGITPTAWKLTQETDDDTENAATISDLRASLTRAEAEIEELQSALWSVLKERRDTTWQIAENAERELQEAIARGWDNHLPTLEEVQAAGPYVHVRADETIEEATERAHREGRLSRVRDGEEE